MLILLSVHVYFRVERSTGYRDDSRTRDFEAALAITPTLSGYEGFCQRSFAASNAKFK